MKKDKIAFSTNSHLSNSVVDLPEFVFNTEKLKIANSKSAENIFDNKNSIGAAIGNQPQKKGNEANSFLSKNADSSIGVQNKNEVQLQNANGSNLIAAEGKIKTKSTGEAGKTLSDIKAPNKSNSQGTLQICFLLQINFIYIITG